VFSKRPREFVKRFVSHDLPAWNREFDSLLQLPRDSATTVCDRIGEEGAQLFRDETDDVRLFRENAPFDRNRGDIQTLRVLRGPIFATVARARRKIDQVRVARAREPIGFEHLIHLSLEV
jgi:hypothetical protein